MIIFCAKCRARLDRAEDGWKHHDGHPADGHPAKPLAARRSRLFDPDAIGLPGYDRVLSLLVDRERATGVPIETWRVGLYVFDGRIRGVFRFSADVDKIPAGSLFQPPEKPSRALLRHHPIVKARLAARAAAS